MNHSTIAPDEMERRCRVEAARRFGQAHADAVSQWWNGEPCDAADADAEIDAVMDDYAALDNGDLRAEILSALSDHNHGDGCLGIIVDQAIADGITDVETIREICIEAAEDARIERESDQ